MNKDVIYIDVDDDVTAIIGKIKKSKEKIVAIVPPKRAGTLQSAVNLRLLDRMAKAEKKNLVLVTNNHALIALAANAKIPVAKNLQSKPEIAEIPALSVDDDDDIIDGNQLPVGEHAKGSVPVKDSTDDGPSREDAIDMIDVEEPDGSSRRVSLKGAAATGVSAKVAAAKSKVKIPNFDAFRKRLFLIIGGGVLLTAGLIWAFVFAPAATVIITARTSPAPVSSTVTLSTTDATDFSKSIVKSVVVQEKKDATVEFDATGQKDLGEKATGTVRFSTNNISSLGTIPAGTKLTSSSGAVFTTDEAVTLTISNYTGQNVGMTAVDAGTASNGATGSMSGAPTGVSAAIVGGATSGGTSRIVKVVSADDIERARGQIIGQDTNTEKQALINKLVNDEKVIDSSFVIERADPVSSPAVNQEAPASGKATLTVSTTYAITAIAKTDLEQYLRESLKKQLDSEATQQIFDNGVDNAQLGNYRKEGDTVTISIAANGQIGPKIDESDIKNRVKGKIYGDAQSAVESINGIDSVDVEFSFFWVRSVPNDTNKITIEFQLEDE